MFRECLAKSIRACFCLGASVAVSGTGLVTPAFSQSADPNGDEWRVAVSSNLWLPETTTRFGTPKGVAESVLSASDALDSLDLGVMLTLAAQKDRLGFAADLVYLNLTANEATPFGVLYSRLESETTLTIPSIYGFYSVMDWQHGTLDVGVGARHIDSELDVRLTPGTLPATRLDQQEDWIDPLLAIRARGRLGENWIASFNLDMGGAGDTDGTWQAVALIGYELTDSWVLRGGYRHLYIARDTNNGPYDFEMTGALLGLVYEF